jgi:hypothetical protein
MKKILLLAMGLLLMLSRASWADVPGFMKEQMGTLKGTVYAKDKPYTNAIVSFFDKSGGPPPIVGSARRVPEAIDRSNPKGEFSLKLLPGTYYMGALQRELKQGFGPPRDGEEYFFMRDAQGKLREFVIETKKVNDAGRVDGMPPGAFHEFSEFITIEGTVTSDSGKPLAGALVTLKDNVDAPRPKFISHATGADGVFSIKVPPGKYYLVGRESVGGGKPGIGAFIGSYGKTNPLGEAVPPNPGNQSGASAAAKGMQGGGGQAQAVEGKNGAVIKGINIQMFKIPDPAETREKYETEARSQAEANQQPPMFLLPEPTEKK